MKYCNNATSDMSVPNLSHEDMVLTEGIEPSTYSLPMSYSTTELRQPKGLDLNTSKVADKKSLRFLPRECSTPELRQQFISSYLTIKISK